MNQLLTMAASFILNQQDFDPDAADFKIKRSHLQRQLLVPGGPLHIKTDKEVKTVHDTICVIVDDYDSFKEILNALNHSYPNNNIMCFAYYEHHICSFRFEQGTIYTFEPALGREETVDCNKPVCRFKYEKINSLEIVSLDDPIHQDIVEFFGRLQVALIKNINSVNIKMLARMTPHYINTLIAAVNSNEIPLAQFIAAFNDPYVFHEIINPGATALPALFTLIASSAELQAIFARALAKEYWSSAHAKYMPEESWNLTPLEQLLFCRPKDLPHFFNLITVTPNLTKSCIAALLHVDKKGNNFYQNLVKCQPTYLPSFLDFLSANPEIEAQVQEDNELLRTCIL